MARTSSEELFGQPFGIDPGAHQVLVWSGKPATAVHAADLLAVVHRTGGSLDAAALETLAQP